MITITILGADQVVLRLREMTSATRAALARAVTASAIELEARAKEKLAGEVLKERTHHLHDSIHHQVQESASAVTGVVGTDVVYAAIHEYGFSGTEQVREHLRRISVAFGKPIAPVEATVRAHSRRMQMPERSFLRSSLKELEPAIVARLRAAVEQAVQR